MKRRLPRTQKELDEFLRYEFNRGFDSATSLYTAKVNEAEAKLKVRKANSRLEALEAATKLASVLGQSIGELARAMASEAEQL